MLTDAELAGMREASEQAMPDTVRITRPSSESALDPLTGVSTPAEPTVIHGGAGRVRAISPQEIEVQFGGEEVTKQRYYGTFPWDAGEIHIDDRVAVVESSDPDVAARSFRVISVSGGSFLVDRRCALEVVE